MTPPASGVIRPIQYLRAAAALMVVWLHGLEQLPWVADDIGFKFGASGVDLFFVISGFIMLVTTAGKPQSPAEFLSRRIVRVVPLYWLTTLAMIGAAILAPTLFRTLRFSTATVVQSLLFVPHESLAFPGNAWPVLVPGWSLDYEMFFYALFAASLLAGARHRLAVLSAAIGLLAGVGYAFGPFSAPVAQIYTSHMLLEFLAGAVLGQLWTTGRLRLGAAGSLGSFAVGLMLLVWRDAPPFGDHAQMIGAVLVVVACLHPAAIAYRSDLLLRLGDASYSIYLTHVFTLGALRVVWMRFGLPQQLVTSILFMGCALAASGAAGFAVYRLVEQPLTKVLQRRLRRRPHAPSGGVVAIQGS